MKAIRNVFASVTVFILFQATAFSQSVKSASNEKEKIAVDCPTEWVVRNFDSYALLVSEPAGKEITYMSTVDVQVDHQSPNVAAYCKKYEENLQQSQTFKDFKVKSKKEIVFKGNKAMEYHCTATAASLQLEWTSIIFLKNGTVYKLTTTSVVQKYLLNKAVTDKIVESFRFI
jgi:hypothetical protein